MPIALELSFRNMDHPARIERAAYEHLVRLEPLCRRATSCHVSIDAPHLRGREGGHYDVRVELRLPGDVRVIGEHSGRIDAHEDMGTVLHEAFHELERRMSHWYWKPRRGGRRYGAVEARAEAFDPGEGIGRASIANAVYVEPSREPNAYG